MIIDVKNFISQEQKYWNELDRLLIEFEREPGAINSLEKLKRLHYLHQRASADLARIMSFSSERLLKEHLESLVSRAYGEIHETRSTANPRVFARNLFRNIPKVFHQYRLQFVLSCLVFLSGAMFGALAINLDPGAREILMPYQENFETPSERVAREESAKTDRLEGRKATFASFLWMHNTQVSIMMMGLGITWGIGTLSMLFYNGLILGAVVVDYTGAGQTQFLLGWLLPHGVIEIPALIIAGQVGFIIGTALIGWGDETPIQQRFRRVSNAVLTMVLMVVMMLCWAGFVEGFISQYHRPIISYHEKIAFGILELSVLVYYLYYRKLPHAQFKKNTDHPNA